MVESSMGMPEILALIVVAVVLLLVLRAIVVGWRSRARLSRFLASPLPAEWWQIVVRDVPLAARIPCELRPRYERLIKEFVAEKNFEACGGLATVSDKIAMVVAANASLLALGRERRTWQALRSVLIYPSSFRSRVAGAGDDELSDGESWSGGTVIFSQERILHDIAFAGNPRNVVIHEFAHQFADTEGVCLSQDFERKWKGVLAAEMRRLQSGDARTILDEYGADDPAEFFAVGTEAFFETPEEMKKSHPELYAALSRIYALDPAGFVA